MIFDNSPSGIYTHFIFIVISKAPLHVGFRPCIDTPQKCGFINASVSMNMLSGTGSQGKYIYLIPLT